MCVVGVIIQPPATCEVLVEKSSGRWTSSDQRHNSRDPGGPVVKTLPSDAGGAGSIPGRGAKIPHASRPEKTKQNIKQKQYCNKINKDFKNGPHQKNLKKKKKKDPSWKSNMAVSRQPRGVTFPPRGVRLSHWLLPFYSTHIRGKIRGSVWGRSGLFPELPVGQMWTLQKGTRLDHVEREYAQENHLEEGLLEQGRRWSVNTRGSLRPPRKLWVRDSQPQEGYLWR